MNEMWAWLLKYPPVLAALVTFVLGVSWQFTTRVFAARPRLRWGITSDTIFLVPIAPRQRQPLPAGAAAAPAAEAVAPPAQLPTDTSQIAGIDAIPMNDAYRARNIWLFNAGSAVAEEVELAFNWAPQHMEWYPHLPTTPSKQPDGRYILTISRLNPKEGVNFSLLSLNQEHPPLMHVRCKGFAGKRINIANQQQFPQWFNLAVGLLMLLGFYTVVSWITSAIVFAI